MLGSYNDTMIPTSVAALMLLGCLIEGMPYGYFQLLRWIVCGVCGYRAFQSHTLQKPVWMWAFLCSVVIFNPLAPIHLGREIWLVLDVGLAVLMLVSLAAVRTPKGTSD